MSRPSVLMLNNHPDEDGNPGQIDGLRLLAETGELGGFSVVNCGPRPGESSEFRGKRVIEAIASNASDVILALSLKSLIRDMDGVGRAIAGRPIIYWEGDPWGRGKRISHEMAAWLEMASHVFSVGGPPQVQLLQANGATAVHHTIHSYDHVLFAESEQGRQAQPNVKVAFIGSNLSRFPLVSGLPGSMGRWRLVGSLKRRLGDDFVIAGGGWPGGVSVGPVPFGQQDAFIQKAGLLTNWDHYSKIESYTSDRLSIAMVAGRAQVSTLHPEMAWMPGPEFGVFLEPTVKDVIRRTMALAEMPMEELLDLGRMSHEWARYRISHREAIRHMLSIVVNDIEGPPSDPWGRLPGAWGEDGHD